ncbi:MAG TPA: hypothetical protein VGR37_01890 [Longimicrobiaceae bacterium]|nr:hypothetical protein [Longimicrobiaceae bacterium]
MVSFLDQAFPSLRGGTSDFYLDFSHAQTVAAALALIDELPAELYALLGTDQYALYTAAVAVVRNTLEGWHSGAHPGHQNQLRALVALHGRHPLIIIKNTLLDCPDEVPRPDTPGLAFVPEPLRSSIRLDISTSYSAHANGVYKAAAVLAGSVIEALLLWRIQQEDQSQLKAAHQQWASSRTQGAAPKKFRDPVTWTLDEYIGVALELEVISDRIASAASLAQHFRNLIHPGKEQRLAETNTRGTATLAVGAMQRVVEHLEARYSRIPSRPPA